MEEPSAQSNWFRSKIEFDDDLDERAVSISVERCWAVVILIVTAIIICVPAGVLSAQELMSGREAMEVHYIADCAVSWVVALSASLMLAWITLGRQVITMSGQGIEIKNRIMGIAYTRFYNESGIRNLRVAGSSNMTLFPMDSKGPFWVRDKAGLAFDYDGRCVYFAQYIGRRDAHRVLSFLNQNYGS